MSAASGLVLSVFPGIDLLGRAFEEEGYTVVRGPDLLWGGDVRTFSPPAGVFEGVIGGPPCQQWSKFIGLIRHNGHEPRFGNLIPEFERVVAEAAPDWFLMENVPAAPIPHAEGYKTWDCMVRDMWVGGVQPRPRRFSLGSADGKALDIEWTALMRPEVQGSQYSILADSRAVPVKMNPGGKLKKPPTVTAMGTVWNPEKQRPEGQKLSIEYACEAMGLPRDFTKHMPFTMHGKRSVIGNGVPMAMGRAIAKAVRRAMEGA